MLNPALDVEALRSEFAHSHRIRIGDLLQLRTAAELFSCLDGQVPWDLTYIDGDQPERLPNAELATLGAEQKAALQNTIQSRAREQFQYMYNSYMMVEAYVEKRNPGFALHRFFEFLNGAPFLDFIKRISGDDTIVKADAQATRYIPGHFLRCHDDTYSREGRRLAYVLSLTKGWHPDWGGLLQFLDAEGRVIETFVPRYNTLHLFRVPIEHCVSYVAPYARQPRYSITGWLRQ
jgi:Rps23 Pro-64 3,4-dihydroxylase Tpa1-like proline 4-hydroxylase